MIFCRVAFQAFGRTYYYLTTDDSIRAGDRVIVPVGNSREEKRGVVTEVTYCQPEDAPYPPGKTKTILRKLPQRPPAF